MATLKKAVDASKKYTPKTAQGIVTGKIVRQSTLDQIRKDGMQKAIGKVKSGKATPEYKTGAIRMYGSTRVVTPKPSVKKPVKGKGFEGIATQGMLKAMQVSEKAAKKVAKGYIAYTKAVTVDAPKTVKKVNKFIDRNAPAAKRIVKQAIADGISAYGGGTKKKAPQLRKSPRK